MGVVIFFFCFHTNIPVHQESVFNKNFVTRTNQITILKYRCIVLKLSTSFGHVTSTINLQLYYYYYYDYRYGSYRLREHVTHGILVGGHVAASRRDPAFFVKTHTNL